MTFNSEMEPTILKGDVHASMKREFIMLSHCSCPRGQVICHHLAALLYYAHYNISSTDVQRQWGTTASKISIDDPIETIDEIYHFKQPYTAISGEISSSKIEDFKKNLGQTNVVGFSWLGTVFLLDFLFSGER
ncbi:hypothetical protein NQ318_004087 [Aromia moschata]|uniref:SWIM-type domain-containing protein n=1 Tax=Aromia moschata TaxID=1265417 RepID=A0AAV8X525_9CUCU|nr:hypothetical protein NQ318_004087 [Aromia moschata]